MEAVVGGGGERADGQDGAGRAGANGVEDVESAVSACSVGSAGDDEVLAVALFRRRVLRILAGCLVAVLLAAAGVGAWLWWTRPPTREVPLPDGIVTDDGLYAQIHGSIPPLETQDGRLQGSRMRVESHEWIGTLKWVRRDGTEETIELHLGETVHIDGLGTVTLLGVNPKPLIPSDQSGGWTYKVYIVLDPGVQRIVY